MNYIGLEVFTSTGASIEFIIIKVDDAFRKYTYDCVKRIPQIRELGNVSKVGFDKLANAEVKAYLFSCKEALLLFRSKMEGNIATFSEEEYSELCELSSVEYDEVNDISLCYEIGGTTVPYNWHIELCIYNPFRKNIETFPFNIADLNSR